MNELKFEGDTFGQIVDIIIFDHRTQNINIYTTLDSYVIEYTVNETRFLSSREIDND